MSLLFALGVTELALRLLDRRVPAARQLPDYGAAVASRELGPAGYLVPGFDAWLTDGAGGRIRWRNDARGFRTDRGDRRDAGCGDTVRLLFVGDSFVAGYRIGPGGRLPAAARALRWNALTNRPPVEALIAEVEDPVTARDYLDRFGVVLEPTLVLVGLTLGNDLDQIYFRQLRGCRRRTGRGVQSIGCDLDPPSRGMPFAGQGPG
ncbi:MAG: hypothetical protein R2862_04670 [Thermoanaerobaculia bacterium]